MAIIKLKNGSYIETINAKDAIRGRRRNPLIKLQITKSEMRVLDALKQLEKIHGNNFNSFRLEEEEGFMGNYYEGTLRFGLRSDIPKDVFHDLMLLSNKKYSIEDFKILKNEKWGKHERYDFPCYEFNLTNYNGREFYLFEVGFCMKGYRINEDDLGEDIYEFLKPYIDTTVYDMSDGGFIGEVSDEDDTYEKQFYVDYDILIKEIKKRAHLCNSNCFYFKCNTLCKKYNICKRAYELGRQDNNED